MGVIQWGAEPELFGPRHAHREQRILRALRSCVAGRGRHLECAAGLGSLSMAIAALHHADAVVAADRSLRSLVELRSRVQRQGSDSHLSAKTRPGQHQGRPVLPVVADITRLPFADESFDSASSAETLEHLDDDAEAASELHRVLRSGGWLVGTVPAEGGGWEEWDRWAGHLRRYTCSSLSSLLASVGFVPKVRRWGWPMVWLYDRVFLKRLNRRRLQAEERSTSPGSLRAVAALGRRRWLVRLVGSVLELDRMIDGTPWGVGLLFEARREAGRPQAGARQDQADPRIPIHDPRG